MTDWLNKVFSVGKFSYLVATFSVLSLLVACGNSSDNGGPTPGGGTQPPAISINLQLVSASDGSSTQTVTSSNPGRVIATVTGITSSVIVTFSTDIGSIPVPTAITDGNNQAAVDIQAGSTLGAGTIQADLSTGENASLVFVIGATNLRMGSGSPFVEGSASIGTAQISAGGTTTVAISIVDENGQAFSEPVDVNFSSSCSNATPPTAFLSSPTSTVNGIASSTYLAQGCVGDDSINITANAGGINLSASGSVNVLSADVGSIEFVSATPENIAIQGAGGIGGSESSTVVFRVRDTNGNPVNGALVDFELNTTAGGIILTLDAATTNAQGLAQAVVNSGTVAASVRITASINNSSPLISTQSSNLVVSTGIPDQDSFTLSASILNVEAWEIDNAQTTISAFLADGFNNPVPIGTTVSFQSEGGKVIGSCTTDVTSSCSVTWNSQNPRPNGATHSKSVFYRATDGDLGPSASNKIFFADGVTPNPSSLGQPYGGRVTITATAVGEESFPDSNGNGRFDQSEVTAFMGTNVSGLPYDLDEAYTDYNEDRFFNPFENDPNEQTSGELEELVDFNSNGNFDTKDLLYNGVLCSIPEHAGCSASQKSLHVRRNLTVVMSGNNPYIKVESPSNGVFNLAPETAASGYIIISDLHNQPLPAGTKVEFNTSTGTIKFGGGTWQNENHNGGGIYSFTMEAPTEPKSGIISVKTTTPNGVVVEVGIIIVNM